MLVGASRSKTDQQSRHDERLQEQRNWEVSLIGLVPGSFEILVSGGGAVASWLVRSPPAQAVWVRALAGDIVLCSWTRYLTLTVPLSTQVHKWIPSGGELKYS